MLVEIYCLAFVLLMLCKTLFSREISMLRIKICAKSNWKFMMGYEEKLGREIRCGSVGVV